jgi:hypothetical protein
VQFGLGAQRGHKGGAKGAKGSFCQWSFSAHGYGIPHYGTTIGKTYICVINAAKLAEGHDLPVLAEVSGVKDSRHIGSHDHLLRIGSCGLMAA